MQPRLMTAPKFIPQAYLTVRPRSFGSALTSGLLVVALALLSGPRVEASAPADPRRPAAQQGAQEVFNQAVADFAAGDLEAAAAGFDRLAELQPSYAPQLWQRGIALYYVGRYQDCREQFELHRTVNPNDVENATWHFLCVARGDSPEAALAAMLPVGPDGRPPMPEVYRMYRGELTPAEVLAIAGDRLSAQFYAHLYIGLYQEAMGRQAEALASINAAADDRYAAVGGYMHMVARVHRDWLNAR